jgi:cytochrome c553
MAFRARLVAGLSFLAVALAAPMVAGAQSPTGNAEAGAKLAYTCIGCHGQPNYKNMYPAYTVPRLRGQRPEYLVAALKAYKSGERSHGTMHSQAASLSDQDIADIAVFLAGTEVATATSPESTSKAERPAAGDACLACHGGNGVGLTADYPSLAGQHADYIQRALTDYQKGGRKNPIMSVQVQTLTADDIEKLAKYYASQKPAVHELHKKQFFFSSN